MLTYNMEERSDGSCFKEEMNMSNWMRRTHKWEVFIVGKISGQGINRPRFSFRTYQKLMIESSGKPSQKLICTIIWIRREVLTLGNLDDITRIFSPKPL